MSPLSDCHFLITNTILGSVLVLLWYWLMHKVGVSFLQSCKCTSSETEKYWSLKLGLHVNQAAAIPTWNSKCLLFAVNKEIGQLLPINVNWKKTTVLYKTRQQCFILSENTSFLYVKKFFLNPSHSLNNDLENSTRTPHRQSLLIPALSAYLHYIAGYCCLGPMHPPSALSFPFVFNIQQNLVIQNMNKSNHLIES